MASQSRNSTFFADRAEHVKTCILPALQQGIWVVCDRFIDSTFAYQVGGRDIEEAVVEQLAQWVLENAWPDLTFLLDIPVETRSRVPIEMTALLGKTTFFLPG